MSINEDPVEAAREPSRLDLLCWLNSPYNYLTLNLATYCYNILLVNEYKRPTVNFLFAIFARLVSVEDFAIFYTVIIIMVVVILVAVVVKVIIIAIIIMVIIVIIMLLLLLLLLLTVLLLIIVTVVHVVFLVRMSYI